MYIETDKVSIHLQTLQFTKQVSEYRLFHTFVLNV